MRRVNLNYHYQFTYEDGKTTDYLLALDPETLSLVAGGRDGTLPEWTRLDFKKCDCCLLNHDQFPFCPISVNIMDLVEIFKTVFSYHDCDVVCHTAERTYVKKTSVMEGLCAIFGVIMATSDCPIMEFLKPMARFHLPFATIEETTVRTASLYLLAQYFNNNDKPLISYDFKQLEKHYDRVRQVNEGLLNRINSVSSEDADKNALITLHSLAQFLSTEIDYSLNSLEHIFSGRFSNLQ
jgi:hypothetical protein